MKLKIVGASMIVLGLLTIPGLAAAHGKHHKHHMKQVEYKGDYKGALPAPVVEACPLMDPYIATLDEMHHNIGRAKPSEDCNKLISFAGGINFDSHWGNRSVGYQGENNQRLSLNDAYLNIYGNVNEWTKAFASMSYNDVSDNGAGSAFTKPGQYSNVYPTHTLTLEQGFMRFANFDQMPFYVQLGKQFQNFGRYNIHPITRSTDQVLSETLATSAEVGFITRMGFNGSLFAFDNPLKDSYTAAPTTTQGHSKTNWGASLGYDHPSDSLGFDVGAGYLYNFTGVNDVAQALSQFEFGTNNTGTYYNRVSALAIYGDLNSGPFSLLARYVTALQDFTTTNLLSHLGSGSGAKPWASNLQAAFNFNAWSKNQNVYVGYQATGDAVYIELPKNRWLAGYNVDVWKNTNLGLELAHDHDYSVGQGGTGNNSNTVAVRAAVKFG